MPKHVFQLMLLLLLLVLSLLDLCKQVLVSVCTGAAFDVNLNFFAAAAAAISCCCNCSLFCELKSRVIS